MHTRLAEGLVEVHLASLTISQRPLMRRLHETARVCVPLAQGLVQELQSSELAVHLPALFANEGLWCVEGRRVAR